LTINKVKTSETHVCAMQCLSGVIFTLLLIVYMLLYLVKVS